MKIKLFKTIAAHYGLISGKSPEWIQEHVALAQKNLYCAFRGFRNHVEGSEMVQSFQKYLWTNLQIIHTLLDQRGIPWTPSDWSNHWMAVFSAWASLSCKGGSDSLVQVTPPCSVCACLDFGEIFPYYLDVHMLIHARLFMSSSNLSWDMRRKSRIISLMNSATHFTKDASDSFMIGSLYPIECMISRGLPPNMELWHGTPSFIGLITATYLNIASNLEL